MHAHILIQGCKECMYIYMCALSLDIYIYKYQYVHICIHMCMHLVYSSQPIKFGFPAMKGIGRDFPYSLQ